LNTDHDPSAADSTEVSESDRSFAELLKITDFRHLWFAQALSQTAHNGIHFVELIMIDRLTGSSGHVGLMILAFSLPAVFFSATAGVVVDHFSKQRILYLSNLVRVFTALSYIVALHLLSGNAVLGWVYGVTFFASAVGQFFAPAEASAIPALVGRNRLLTANSLFNLTTTGTQILGLIVIFPLIVKLGEVLLGPGRGLDLSFALVALMYGAAAWLVRNLPVDRPNQTVTVHSQPPLKKALADFKEGFRFIRAHPRLWAPMINLSMTATIVMILVTVAPGYAARVLHVSREDAVYIFAPSGVGMVLGTLLIGRYGYRLQREVLSNTGVIWQGVILALFGLAGWLLPGTVRLTVLSSVFAFCLGVGFAAIGIPAQTMLQERTPSRLRGRVFSVQFLLANMLSIPPMLFAGTLADRIGIPPVVIIMAVVVLVLGSLSIWITRQADAADLDRQAAEQRRRWAMAEYQAELETEMGLTLEQTFNGATKHPVPAPRQQADARDEGALNTEVGD
jgi:MFS family permease